ncbi:hypothetical protein E2C01_049823 [Portunus trituberculatus]|uniref:Uncharacterized protein n=1 Tax=Portunus trituberculatus TaxID=210409 RepID=A0A5B7GET9_PORTR|nr:hypothetical protein [Portunus trituberculatus]
MSAGLEWRIVVCLLAAAVGMSEARGGPYLRSNLARAMYNRMLSDERLRNMNMSKVMVGAGERRGTLLPAQFPRVYTSATKCS